MSRRPRNNIVHERILSDLISKFERTEIRPERRNLATRTNIEESRNIDPLEVAVHIDSIEVDETSINYRRKGAPPPRDGRSHDAKLIVAGAVEVQGNGPGRIRLAPIEDFSADSLHAFIGANLAPGGTAKTDAWPAYPGAPGVTHEPHTVGKQPAHHVLPCAARRSR